MIAGGGARIGHHGVVVDVVPVRSEDKSVLLHLMQLYCYDFSEFTNDDVDDHGYFGFPARDRYWTEPDRHPYLFRVDGRLAGFALVHSGVPHDMAEFFVVRKYRRNGVGREAARTVFQLHRGDWQVRQMTLNTRATAFWRRAIPVDYVETVIDKGPMQTFHIAVDQ